MERTNTLFYRKMLSTHISTVQNFPELHSKIVEMTVPSTPDGNIITHEITDAILHTTIPAVKICKTY